MSIKGLSLHFYKEGMDYPEYVFGLVFLLGGGGEETSSTLKNVWDSRILLNPLKWMRFLMCFK